MRRKFLLSLLILGMATSIHSTVFGQSENVKKALAITPKQKDVDFDLPTGDELKSIKFAKTTDQPGFVIYDESGRILRKFYDSNRDGKLDQWSYFKNGTEVYRDIDENHDLKTDQYRWLGNGGTKWGLDPNQDGKIDEWRVISAEEAAFEVFQAIKNQDTRRFEAVLLSDNEFNSLGLGDSVASDVRKRIQTAKSGFAKLCKSQKAIGSRTEWIHSGNGQPSMSPKGANGNNTDIIVYDHASAVFKNGDYGQLALGTLVKVGSVWKAIELPEIVAEGVPIRNGGAFFPLPQFGSAATSVAGGPNPDEEKLVKLYKELEDVEKQLSASKKPLDIAKLEEKQAKIKEQFFVLTKDPTRKRDWLENVADTVASAYQSERFPDGLEFLDGFLNRLEKANYSDGLDYIRWRAIFAKFGLATDSGDKKARDRANEALIEDLKDFQSDFKTSPISADALCQLGIHYEINEDTDEATQWYREAVKRFPKSVFGRRAKGALVRLEGVGKPVSFVGEDLSGRKFSLRDPKLRDKVIVIHFWETWCADGLDEVKRLVEKYKDEVVFVGANIENETEEFRDYLRKNRDITWFQLHAPGSMENSVLAHQFGVPSEPLVLLLDKKGNLVNANVTLGDLEREIERQRRKK